MIVINNVDSQKFSFNGVEYFKNFTPVVVGNKIRVLNTYDSSIELTDAPRLYSEFEVEGVVYGNVIDLQTALLPILYTRNTLGGGDFIPLSGTTVGNPVTGDIQYPYDDGYKIFIDNNSGIERGIAIADTFGMFENSTNGNTLFDLIGGNLRLTTSVLASKGILSGTDFSTIDPTNKLIYAQRQYVDNALVQVYKNISANTTLDDSYHNSVIWVTATCNITIPSGLRADFTANVRTFTGATASYLTSGTVINTESDGYVQAPKTMANISTYSTNNFIISGGGLS